MTPCRLCGAPVGPRGRWGHTGCSDCERAHLQAEIAAGAPWWVDPTPYDQADHEAHRQASHAVREALHTHQEPLWTVPAGFYGTDHPDPEWSANDYDAR